MDCLIVSSSPGGLSFLKGLPTLAIFFAIGSSFNFYGDCLISILSYLGYLSSSTSRLVSSQAFMFFIVLSLVVVKVVLFDVVLVVVG